MIPATLPRGEPSRPVAQNPGSPAIGTTPHAEARGMTRQHYTIDIRQEGCANDVRNIVHAGHCLVLFDSEETFPPFELRTEGACFRVEPCVGIEYALFADLGDALRFGLTHRPLGEPLDG